MSAFYSLLKRDLILAYRNPSDFATPVIFFFIAVTLFSFAAATDGVVLRTIASGVIWISALLASMLSLDEIFRSDFEDGSLDLILNAPSPLSLLVLAKVTAHWISTGLPLVAASPILGMLMNLDSHSIFILVAAVALSTPTFSLIGAFGAALVVSQQKAGMLLSLLTLPLCIPVLIYSISSVLAAGSGLPVSGHLSLLGAFLIFCLTIAPFAIGGTLRTMAES